MPDVDPEPGAVHEEMDRTIGVGERKSDRAQPLAAPAKASVVGNGNTETEQLDDRAEEPLCLPKRQGVDLPNGQGGFDRDIGVDALAAGPATGPCSPAFAGVLGEPDRDVTAPAQRPLVCRPVTDFVGLLGLLVLAALRKVHEVGILACGRGAMHQRPTRVIARIRQAERRDLSRLRWQRKLILLDFRKLRDL